jgi:ubiquinol-cytochrome c reductase cytochrome c subunit
MRRLVSTWLAPATLALAAFASVNAAPQATAPQGAPQAAATAAGNADKGRQLFLKSGCYECHGTEGQGATGGTIPEPYRFGPRLAPNPMPLRALMNYVRKPTGPMPAYTAKVISDQDLADIHAYLQSRPQPVALDMIPTFERRK